VSDPVRPRTRARKSSTLARHGRLRKSNPFLALAKVTAAAVAVVMVSTVSVAAIATYDVAATVRPGVTLGNENGGAPKIGAIGGGVNLLLVGSDSRQGQGDGYGDPTVETGVLNDVTMLMHIAEDHSSATVVSIPRDTFVSIPDCTGPDGSTFEAVSYEKINESLGRGGLACTVKTVEQLTGLHIPYAALVQFNGVAALSEAVGGVPVCIAEPIKDPYTDLDLPAGEQMLKGKEALQFLRTRHGVGDGSDLGRISNQQVFLSSLVRTLKSAKTLSDPIKVYSIAKAAAKNMQLSNSLNSIDTMAAIAMALKDIPLDKVVFVQYPTGSADGGVIPSEESAAALMSDIKHDVAPVLNPGDASFLSVRDPKSAAPADASTDAPTADSSSDAATDDATADPSATPTPSALPSDVYGQTAGERTCSAGRPLSDQ